MSQATQCAAYRGGTPPSSPNAEFLSKLTSDDFLLFDAIVCALAGRLGIHPTELMMLRFGSPDLMVRESISHPLVRRVCKNLGTTEEQLVDTLRANGWLPASAGEWLRRRNLPTRFRCDSEWCGSTVREPKEDVDDGEASVFLEDQLASANPNYCCWDWRSWAGTVEEAIATAGEEIRERDRQAPPAFWFDPIRELVSRNA
ncbi:MAG: hypothetical protein AB7S38_18320 [Vulcanimicrobiota bacterium]